MPKLFRYSLLLFLGLVLAACGTQSSIVDSSGLWNGQLSGAGDGLPFSLVLSQEDSNVLGALTLQVPNAPLPLPLSGTIIGSQLNLSAAGGGTTIDISSTISGDSMSGTVTTFVSGEGSSVLQLTATR